MAKCKVIIVMIDTKTCDIITLVVTMSTYFTTDSTCNKLLLVLHVTVNMSCLNISNVSLLQSDIVTVSLAGVSTVACIIAVAALLYYKLWHKFIYRLVLYKLLSLIGSSLSTAIWIVLMIMEDDVTYVIVNRTFGSIVIGGLVFATMIGVCISICIYLMALHNYQFTYKADLCLLVLSILPLIALAILIILIFGCGKKCGPAITPTEEIASIICFLVNIVFTLLTVVPLSCRACGYNMCMKTTATKESHRKALIEILPFFILTLLPLFSYIIVFIILDILQNSNDFLYSIFTCVSRNFFYCLPGLFSAVSVAIHLFSVRNKLRSKRRREPAVRHGSINRRCTYRTGVYTSEGMSETCNTEYIPVSENEEDTRLLLHKNNNQMQQ